MSSTYTWEDVMLGIDVRDEARREEKEQQDILDKQQEEANAASRWSLGLSILGGALFGPVGYAAGKIIGRYGADIAYDWEGDEVSEGKFYKEQSRKVNEILETAAKDQTATQALNTLTDIATMYVQAGGLQEGPTDFTTFGSGDAEWSVLGKGPKVTYEGAGTIDVKAISNPDYVPGLFSEGFKEAVPKLRSAYTAGLGTASTLTQWLMATEESKEEEPKVQFDFIDSLGIANGRNIG